MFWIKQFQSRHIQLRKSQPLSVSRSINSDWIRQVNRIHHLISHSITISPWLLCVCVLYRNCGAHLHSPFYHSQCRRFDFRRNQHNRPCSRLSFLRKSTACITTHTGINAPFAGRCSDGPAWWRLHMHSWQ